MRIRDILLIIAGDLLLAIAISVFLEPFHLVTGGVSGIAIIISDYSGRAGYAVPLWVTNIVLNIPLFLAGLKTMGKNFLLKTAFATILLSAALYLTAFLPPLTEDVILASVFGGALMGLGIGLVLRAAATTGGSDLASSILHTHILNHYSIARILFVIDSAIIVAGLLAFGVDKALFAIIAVFVASRVTDSLLEGLSFAKAVFVISDESEMIASAILHEMKRGVTSLHGEGMFTRNSKNILLCVMSAKELVRLKSIVRICDLSAFVIVADVREVLGEGFTERTNVCAANVTKQ